MKLETNLSKYYINSTKTITFYAIEMKKNTIYNIWYFRKTRHFLYGI